MDWATLLVVSSWEQLETSLKFEKDKTGPTIFDQLLQVFSYSNFRHHYLNLFFFLSFFSFLFFD